MAPISYKLLEEKGFVHIYNRKKEWKIHFDKIEKYIKMQQKTNSGNI